MKTILVTGASGDIGSAIVKRLAEQNTHTIIAVVRDMEHADTIKNLPNISLVQADLSLYEEVVSLSKKIPEKIDWIICAHGFIDKETNLLEQSVENIQKTFNVNLLSLVYLAKTCAERLTSGMVCISSTSGISANGRYAAYSASKAGVNSLMVALARNRPEQTFISLCPGPTLGNMRKHLGAEGGQDPMIIATTVTEMIAPQSTYKSGDIVSVRDGKTVFESRLA
jgi:3-oxoacyl-[acyl-carrier protein] reductase